LGDAWETNDSRAILSRVDFAVLDVDGERLILSVANLPSLWSDFASQMAWFWMAE
jgi:hypothetical protein